MSFDSYYWHEWDIPDPRLGELRRKLASGEGGVDAFLELLQSDSVVAVGVALDHYRYEESLTRFGRDNPFEELEPTILEVARRVLAAPPHGMSHASALRVLGDLGDSDDGHTIASILRAGATHEVVSAALWAAGAALSDTEEEDQELVEALSGVIFDESRRMQDRVDAILAFSHMENETVGIILARSARLPHEEIQVEALAHLIDYHSDAQLETVEDVVNSWAQDVGPVKEQILRSFRAAKAARKKKLS
ncbi:hypothetical protein ACIF85_20325 [Streptomyces sp. NPDC086033]|uniref:hypothetical protein n=1 Tax=Streptomyces sp. NPDC086033 TaxID=3365747 RepID=UPI0037D8A50B